MKDSQDWLDKILVDAAESICGEWCTGEHTGAEAVYRHMAEEKSAIRKHILQEVSKGELEAIRKHLSRWKEDISYGFIPLCSYCNRKTAKVVGQTARGKYAQENNELPRNWGYYCQRCYERGMEIEREAMYG